MAAVGRGGRQDHLSGCQGRYAVVRNDNDAVAVHGPGVALVGRIGRQHLDRQGLRLAFGQIERRGRYADAGYGHLAVIVRAYHHHGQAGE